MKRLLILSLVFMAQAAFSAQITFTGTLDLANSILDKSPVNEKIGFTLTIRHLDNLGVTRASSTVEEDYGDPDLDDGVKYYCHSKAILNSASAEIAINYGKQSTLNSEVLSVTTDNSSEMENEKSPCVADLTGTKNIFMTGNYNKPFTFTLKIKGRNVRIQMMTPFLWAEGNLTGAADGYTDVKLKTDQVNGVQWFAFPEMKDGSKITLSNHAALKVQ